MIPKLLEVVPNSEIIQDKKTRKYVNDRTNKNKKNINVWTPFSVTRNENMQTRYSVSGTETKCNCYYSSRR